MMKTAFRGMGTTIEIGVHVVDDAQTEQARQAMAEAARTMVGLESVLSRFIPDNDLDRLNRSAGDWVQVSPATSRILRRAERAFEQSGGLFNPFLGSVMEQMGYRESFERMDKLQPGRDEVRDRAVWPTVLQSQGHALVWSQEDETMVTLAPGIRLDLGGIAKGWIVEEAARKIAGFGLTDFVVNAGGDMVCRGENGVRPWRVAIEHPTNQNEPAITLELHSLALATSGTYRRRWKLGGRDVHHLVDPRTGAPAKTDIVSCSVVHRDLVEAEWMAKKALLLGVDDATAWLRETDASGWVLITEKDEVKTGGLAG
jgi:FAD:protein FMN transferase